MGVVVVIVVVVVVVGGGFRFNFVGRGGDGDGANYDGDRHNACAVLELVLPTDKTRDQHRKSISNVVNMAHSEGKHMQLSWKQQQSKEDDQTRSVDGDELR